MSTQQGFTIPKINETEPWQETMAFINANKNWDEENQRYRLGDSTILKTKLTDCEIFWRGQYLILADSDGIIHFWESRPSCYLEEAVKHMCLHKPAAWKTLDKLIALREGIRQTEVNCCGYVEQFLEGRNITHRSYAYFMAMARAHDYQHHGGNTF